MSKAKTERWVHIAALMVLIGIPTAGGRACVYNKCLSTAYGQMKTDNITMATEVHGYSLEMARGDVAIIRVNCVSGWLSPVLVLINSSGTQIARAGTPGTAGAEIVTPAISASGGYTILVYDFSGAGRGAYNLSVQCVNRPANPISLVYDGVRRDTLIYMSQMKTYQFAGEKGDVVSIEMIAIDQHIDPHLRLFDPQGGVIIGDVDDSFALISGITLADSGKYTIVATDYEGNDLGEYFLVLLHTPTDAADGDRDRMPDVFALEQNHPNPFNPQTTIGFSLPKSSPVTLDVYNILGERVRTLVDADLSAGYHSVIWDGRDAGGEEVGSGVYFYHIRAEQYSATRKMLLIE